MTSMFTFNFRRGFLASKFSAVVRVGVLFLLAGAVRAQAPVVTSLSPARNARSAPRTTDVTVSFSQALSNNASTQQALKVFSQQAGGKKVGTTTVSGNRLTFNPATDFKPGETVQATITGAAQSTNGAAAIPHVFQFTTATTASSGIFSGGFDLGLRSPQGMALGDADNDGDLDLFLQIQSLISIRLNTGGSGDFVESFTVPTTYSTSRLVLGDLDGDGDLDFVAANTVARNNGDATFTTSQLTSFTTAQFSVAPALGDVDGDGDLDLVFPNINGSATVGLNDGNGTFPTVRSLPTVQNNYVSAVALGDLDGDGDLDLLLANQSQNSTVSVRLNNGTGSFSGTQEIGGGGSTLALSDLDGDGDLDLVTSSNVYWNNGSGEFGSPRQGGVGGDALGDVDGDGDLDLIKANSNTVTVRLNNGAGGFISSQNVAVAIGSTQSLALGDLDGDGDLDLVTSKNYGDGLSVRLNQNQPLPLPVLTSLSTTSSAVGSSLVITGTDLVNVTSVTVNGVTVPTADVLSNSPTQLTVVVPTGATTGPVVITTTAGISNGLVLSVLPYFAVKEVSPVRNSVVAPRAAPVAVSFTQDLGTGFDPQQTISVFGQQAGGKKAGTATVSGNTLTLDPSMDFKAGETVFATIKTGVRSSDGQTLAKPHIFQFTAAAAPSPALFNAGTEVSLGLPGPTTFTTGDVDGDGDLDLLLRGFSAATGTNVTVRLNNGAGDFSGNQAVSVGAASVLVLGDIDADGDLDLLTTGSYGGSNIVYVRRNNGQGTFSGNEQVSVGSGASSVILGDLEGDGDLDLVVGNYVPGTASIRFNNGAGIFTGNTELVATGTEAVVVTALGDVDSDGDLDLVTNSRVLLNNGAGGFTSSQVFAGSNVLTSAAQLSDLDGDGDLDLLSNGVRLNDGNGAFGNTQQAGLQGNLGDVDGDGDLDLLTDNSLDNNSLDNTVSVRLNNGRSAFALSQQVQMGPRPSGTTAADLDGDGDLDLLTATYGTNPGAVNVRLNQLPTAPPAVTAITPARNASSVPRTTPVAVTFDRPLSNTYTTQQALNVFSQPGGNKQAGAATVSGNTLTFTPNPSFRAGETILTTLTATAQSTGGASLAQPQVFQFTTATVPSTGTFAGGYELGTGDKPAAQVLVGDVDNDGDLDIVASNTSNEPNNIVSVRRNLGNNTFGNGTDLRVGSFTQAMAWGDIDKNGLLDLLVASTSPNGSSLYVFRNSFSGTAGPTQLPIGSGNISVVLGDVNADSNLDLITTSSSTGSVSVRLNDGTGAFGTAQDIRAVAPESALTVAVGDADGDLDLITNNGVLFNNGIGRFNDLPQLPTGLAATYVAVGDVDRDNDLDYVLVTENADAASSTVRAWLNNGAGTFAPGNSFTVASRPPRIALGDGDGDGDLDLFVATASTLSVYRNNGTGNFSGTPPTAAGATAGGLALADMDNNGTLDIITSVSAPAGIVGVRLNNQLVLASAATQASALLSVYPNPTAGAATLVYTAVAAQTATLTIHDALGQRVAERTVKLQVGANQVPVSAERFSAGFYQLTLRLANGQRLSQKLLVQP